MYLSSAGVLSVYPSASPRDTIVAFWAGKRSPTRCDMSAAPLVIREDPLLLSETTRRCCRPATMRSRAASKSSCRMKRLFERPAKIRRLVAEVREIGPGKTGGLTGDRRQVDVLVERLVARVDARIASRPATSGADTSTWLVEAAGPQQRGVEILEPVRGGHHDDLVARGEAVELDEELVERLVVLAVEPADTRCPRRRARR